MAPAVTPPAPVPTPVPAVVAVVAPVVPVGGGGGGCQVGGEDVGDAHGVPPQRFDVLVSVSSPPVWLLPHTSVSASSRASSCSWSLLKLRRSDRAAEVTSCRTLNVRTRRPAWSIAA